MKAKFSHKILTCDSLLVLFWDKHVLLAYKAYIICALFSPHPFEIIFYHNPTHSPYASYTVLLAVPPAHSPFPPSLPSPVLLPLPGCFSPTRIHGSLPLFTKCSMEMSLRQRALPYFTKNTTVFAGRLSCFIFLFTT